MDLWLTDPQLKLRDRARSVAAAAVSKYGRVNDSWVAGYCKEFALELAELGWIGMTWPTEVGGGGYQAVDRLIVFEELIAAGAPLAAMWFGDRQVGPSLLTFGTAKQRARYLPGILSGRETWCIGMSEPNAGSDLASISTTARRYQGHWLVSGRKIWTSFASKADYCYLICRTFDVWGKAGISELIVPMSQGVEVHPIRDVIGNLSFCEVFFDDVEVPFTNLVGHEGDAFRQTMRQLDFERGGIDRLMSNYFLYREAVERSDKRDTTIRQEIASLEAGFRVGRLMIYQAAAGQAGGRSAITKAFCTEHEVRVAEFVARVAGASAMQWSEVSRAICSATSYTISGGTAEILRNIVAERVLGLPR
jgi:alkylation response protein AidB-like acyl-CoA dehydrogenase